MDGGNDGGAPQWARSADGAPPPEQGGGGGAGWYGRGDAGWGGAAAAGKGAGAVVLDSLQLSDVQWTPLVQWTGRWRP